MTDGFEHLSHAHLSLLHKFLSRTCCLCFGPQTQLLEVPFLSPEKFQVVQLSNFLSLFSACEIWGLILPSCQTYPHCSSRIIDQEVEPGISQDYSLTLKPNDFTNLILSELICREITFSYEYNHESVSPYGQYISLL